MARFRDVNVGSDPAAKHILKFESGKDYVIKIVKDDVRQWNEVWPCYIGSDGNKVLRRFVCSEDNSNVASLVAFKKSNDIGKLLNGVQRDIDNWNTKTSFACLAIVGVEQKVKDPETGKIKNKIMWDKTCKIYQFGISVFRKLEALNHNPTLIERAEEKGLNMCDPDDSASEGSMCTDVYAIRVNKATKGKKTEYNVQADKLVGSVKGVENIDTVMKDLEVHIKAATEVDVDAFISSIGGKHSGEEAESEDEEVEEKPAKKSKKPADDEEVEDIDVDDEEGEKPAKKAKKPAEDEEVEEKPAKKAKKPADDDVDIDDIDIDEVD